MVRRRPWDEKLAESLSVLLHPFLVTAATMWLAVYFTQYSFWEGLKWTALYLMVVIAPVFALLQLRVHSGRASDLDVTLREQRPVFYVVGITGMLVFGTLVVVGNAPRIVLLSVGAATASNVIALVVNRFTKISAHAAGMAGSTTVLALVAPWLVGMVMGLLTVALGWARVRLGRHTVAQVLLGWGVAIACVLLLFRLFGL